jgi:EpsI family protein
MPSLRARVALVIAVLAASAVLVARSDRYEDVPLRSSFSVFPMDIGGWQGIAQPGFSSAVLDILRVDDYLTRMYVKRGDSALGLYIGYWRSQRQGDTIHSPLNCLPGAGWEPLSKRTIFVPTSAESTAPLVPVNRYLIQKNLDRQLVLYWYQSHGRVVASEYSSKFWLVADAMRLNRTDGAIVRVTAPIADDSPAAEARAEQSALAFVQALFPELGRFLPV